MLMERGVGRAGLGTTAGHRVRRLRAMSAGELGLSGGRPLPTKAVAARPRIAALLWGKTPTVAEKVALLWGRTPTVAGKVEGGGGMVEGAADGAVEGLGNWAFVSTFAV